jgi:hypothetical protein
MIVRPQGGELILIKQLDHSALSSEFAQHWGNGQFERPQPLGPVVLASACHDEGWRETDDRPLYDPATKRPVHFRAIDVRAHIPLYRQGIERIIALDPYAGLLVSMHGSGIYQGRYGAGPIRMQTQTEDVRPLMEAFVAEQETRQAELKRRLWQPAQRRSDLERQVWAHYEWLQAWDLLSLFVCLSDLERLGAEERIAPVPVAVGGRDVEIMVRAIGDRTVTVDPYPFDVPALDAAVPGRAIPNRDYASQDDLRAAVRSGRDVTIRCRLVAG